MVKAERLWAFALALLLVAACTSTQARLGDDEDVELLRAKDEARRLGRELQDDSSQLCSSMMEVTEVTTVGDRHTEILYPVATGYPNSLKRCVIFKPTSDLFLEVTLKFLNTEPNYDFVEVYPIGSYNKTSLQVHNVGARLARWSGMSLPSAEERTVIGGDGVTLMVVLRTDSNRNYWTGFQANVHSKYRDCYHGMSFIQATSVPQVFSDGFVDEYPPNYAYCWVVAPPYAAYLQLAFSSFNTERDFADFVEISVIETFNMRSKSYTGKSRVLGRFSGMAIPPNVIGGNDELMLVVLRTDASNGFAGFTARVWAPGTLATSRPTPQPTASDCEGGVQYYTAPSDGQAISDGLEAYFLNFAKCYVIKPESALATTAISLTTFSLINSDRLEIFALKTPLSTDVKDRLAGTLASVTQGTPAPWTFVGQPGQTLVLQLRTDKTATSAHFSGTIRSGAITSAPTLAPTSAECSKSMVVYDAPQPNGEVQFDDNDADYYSGNYQACAIIKGVPGYRYIITFDEIGIQDDKIEVFHVTSYNTNAKTLSGHQPLLKTFTTAGLRQDKTRVVTTNSDLPVVVSLRTNFGLQGRGFVARAKLVPEAEVAPTAQPTMLTATNSPTTTGKCDKKMVVLKARRSNKKITDALKVVPRGVTMCWVVKPFNDMGFTQITFTQLALGTGATVEVGSIKSFNKKAKTYTGFNPGRSTSVTLQGTEIQGRPGDRMIVILKTDRKGADTGGFTAKVIAPCFCPMFKTAATCNKALCGCSWRKDTKVCDFL